MGTAIRDVETFWLGIGFAFSGGLALLLLANGPSLIVWLLVLGCAIGATVAKASSGRDGRSRDHPVHRPATDGGEPDIELVVAIIRPGKLNAVKQALAAVNAPSLTVSNVSGRGTQRTETGKWKGEEYIVDLHQKVKVECAVTDDTTDVVINAIQEAAHTGEPGDGKIFLLPVLDACRVSTNERGIEAM